MRSMAKAMVDSAFSAPHVTSGWMWRSANLCGYWTGCAKDTRITSGRQRSSPRTPW